MAQFVPLKIDTEGDSFQEWARQYRAEGTGIPVLYVVRADGQMLYGKSGSKPGDELPAFLAQQLTTAGTIFSDAQLVQIKSVVDDSTKALAENDDWAVVRRFEALRKFGTPGKFGSYAAVATEADALYARLIERGTAALKTAQEQKAGENKFAGVLGIISANRIYGKMPELKKDLVSAERELGKDKSLAEELKQAESLDRALALLGQKGGKEKARPALDAIVTRFAGTPAAEMASSKLTELGIPVPSAPALRTWTDTTGKFRIEAELLSVADGKVKLKKKDGEVVTVPIEKLSKSDQEFVAQQNK